MFSLRLVPDEDLSTQSRREVKLGPAGQNCNISQLRECVRVQYLSVFDIRGLYISSSLLLCAPGCPTLVLRDKKDAV